MKCWGFSYCSYKCQFSLCGWYTDKRERTPKVEWLWTLLYLFEHNEKMICWSQKRGWWRYSYPKFQGEQVRGNTEEWRAWSTAMAMQLEEARYRYDLEDSSEKRIAAGKMEEKRQFLHKLIEIKYHEDHMTWLCTLTAEQIENISNLILTCDTFRN